MPDLQADWADVFFFMASKWYFSHTSLMTSRRPDTSKVYTNDPYWRDTYNFTTFQQYFKQKGYTSVGLSINQQLLFPSILFQKDDEHFVLSFVSWEDGIRH